MDIQNLKIKEKAQLVAQLTKEIVEETRNDDFTNKSEKNEKISGLMRTFGEEYYINYANQLNTFIQQTD